MPKDKHTHVDSMEWNSEDEVEKTLVAEAAGLAGTTEQRVNPHSSLKLLVDQVIPGASETDIPTISLEKLTRLTLPPVQVAKFEVNASLNGRRFRAKRRTPLNMFSANEQMQPL